MKNLITIMLLKNLIKNPPSDIRKLDIKGLALNSKDVKKNYIFFAIKGNNYNGEKYINHAISRGAAVIVCSSNIKFKGNTVDEFIRFGFSEEYNRDLSKRAYLINTAAEFRAKENISYGGLWHLQIEKKWNISLRDLKINVKKQLAKISKFLIKYA